MGEVTMNYLSDEIDKRYRVEDELRELRSQLSYLVGYYDDSAVPVEKLRELLDKKD